MDGLRPLLIFISLWSFARCMFISLFSSLFREYYLVSNFTFFSNFPIVFLTIVLNAFSANFIHCLVLMVLARNYTPFVIIGFIVLQQMFSVFCVEVIVACYYVGAQV